MKKAIKTYFYGEGNPNNSVSEPGFVEVVKWKSNVYYDGPENPGKYLTSDGKGIVLELHSTGRNKTGIELFKKIIDGMYDQVTIDDITGDELTDSMLVNLARETNIWYDTYDVYHYGEYDGTGINIWLSDKPKYYLDINLDGRVGPLDEEEYEKEEVERDW